MMLRLLAPGLLMAVVMLPPAARAQSPSVEISGAWVRATAPHQDEAAAYMTLVSRLDDRLTGATSTSAAMAMLHTTAHDDGVMRMRDVDGIDLPAGKSVLLSPNGTHLMLGGLQKPLRAGDVVALSLSFQHSAPIEVRVEVLPLSTRAFPGDQTR